LASLRETAARGDAAERVLPPARRRELLAEAKQQRSAAASSREAEALRAIVLRRTAREVAVMRAQALAAADESVSADDQWSVDEFDSRLSDLLDALRVRLK
jgi:hypothetical protein